MSAAHDRKMEALTLARLNAMDVVLAEIEAHARKTSQAHHEHLQATTVALIAIARTWLERWPEASRERLLKLSMHFVPIFDSGDESDDNDDDETIQ